MNRRYTARELTFVMKNIRGRSYVEMTKMFNEQFGLSLTLKQMETLTYKHGIRNGIGSFLPGHVPANKGKKDKAMWKRYWLRTGRGRYRPVGSERVTSGYVEVKTADPDVWNRKHTAIWEAANGKVPKGHVVIFADGNNRNFDLDNLLLITRGELMVMNHLGLIKNSKDLTVTGKMIADLSIAIAVRKGTSKTLKRKK